MTLFLLNMPSIVNATKKKARCWHKNRPNKYDEGFKKRAVRLRYSSERTIKATAESLEINANMLHRWRNQYTPDGDKTKIAVHQEEINKLLAELLNLKKKTTYLSMIPYYYNKELPLLSGRLVLSRYRPS